MQIQSYRTREESIRLLKNITFDAELDKILRENKIQLGESEDTEHISREESLSKIFKLVWLSDLYKEPEIKLVETFCYSKKIPWHDKTILASALTLSLLRNFDQEKFFLLFKLFEQQEHQVWQRALVGIFINLQLYRKRIALYPKLQEEINNFTNWEYFREYLEFFLQQFIKAQDTEKITKKWETEILPEMMKMQSKIEKKLDIENIISENFLEDKNPDWERVFQDSPDLMDKLQEFSQMQIEGADVFMSAFSKLKHFPFFNTITNWFLPFYKENEHIKNSLSSDKIDLGPFVEKLEDSHYMCNSDKYSFCLNLQFIPDTHKDNMMELFNAEMDNIGEIAEQENMLKPEIQSKQIITQYIQDLYRFFKLHPFRHEIKDIFERDITVFEEPLRTIFNIDQSFVQLIAEYYFEKDRFEEATVLYQNLEKEGVSTSELFEKVGYCFQRLGNYKSALKYYKKAELFDSNKAWLNKKIALCYRYLDDHHQALDYYKLAEQQEPENLYIQAYIGNTLVSLKEYDEALKYYFKVEYLSPDNHKIRRPIAWISLKMGKLDTAENYFRKIIEAPNQAAKEDYISLGHVYWCKRDLKDAIDTYRSGFEKMDQNRKHFIRTFNDDKEILMENGFSDLEIGLMVDYISFQP